MNQHLTKGTVLNNRYRIHLLLGKGSFGTVFRCLDTQRNSWKAVKIITKTTSTNEAYVGERLTLEGLRGIAGVPVIYDSFDLGRQLEALVMDLFVGDLHSLKLKPFSPSLIMKIGVELMKILEQIHRAGFIHRDLKCGNVMVPYSQKASRLVIIDYNLAIRFARPRRLNSTSMRRIPVPVNDVDFGKCTYAPRRCVEGLGAQESEDCEQVALMLMVMSGVWPFGGTRQEILEQKQSFATTPWIYLSKSTAYLWPVLEILLAQQYAQKPQYKKIMNVMRNNGFPIHESAPIKVETTATGRPFIQ